MPIRVETLGGLAILSDGKDVPELVSLCSRVALLVYLAVEARARREKVMAIFWPESDAANARHALRQAIYQLNRILDGTWLETVGDDLIVTSLLGCDVTEFRDAVSTDNVAAVHAAYRGAFLDAVHLVDNPQWESWVEAQRSTLTREHRRFCRQHVARCLANGDTGAAINGARLWVERNGLDDEAQHRLIELLVESGNRLDALSQYYAYVRLLERDDLTPLDATVALVQGIRSAESPVPGPSNRQDRRARRTDPLDATVEPDSSSAALETGFAPAESTTGLSSPTAEWAPERKRRLAGYLAAATVLILAIVSFVVPAFRAPAVLVSLRIGNQVALLTTGAYR